MTGNPPRRSPDPWVFSDCSRHRDTKRVKGIEPSQPAWKAGALPLSYTRMFVRSANHLSISSAVLYFRRTSTSLCTHSFIHWLYHWGVQDSNLRRQCQRIYNPPPLTTRATPRPINLVSRTPSADRHLPRSRVISPRTRVTLQRSRLDVRPSSPQKIHY